MRFYQYKEARQKAMGELFDKHGVFFAFSKSQIDEQKQEGVKYYSLDGGMFIPQSNYKPFNEEFEKSDEVYISKAKELFTPTQIITYELGNHEYCITYDLEDTKDALEDFSFNEQEYSDAIKEYLANCEF